MTRCDVTYIIAVFVLEHCVWECNSGDCAIGGTVLVLESQVGLRWFGLKRKWAGDLLQSDART